MPIARFQMPDGRVARFEVPDGTTPEQAQSMMESHFKSAPTSKKEDGVVMSTLKSVASAPVELGRWIAEKGVSGEFQKGLVSGAADIGNTLLNVASSVLPEKSAARKWNDERDASLKDFNKSNDGTLFSAGRLTSNIAGTAGVGPAIAKAGMAAGPRIVAAAPRLSSLGPTATGVAESIATSGFRTGLPAATTVGGKAGELGIRSLGGGITGAISAGLVNPDDAAVGAAVGAALPPAIRGLGVTGAAIGKGVQRARTPQEAKSAKIILDAAEATSPDQIAAIRAALAQQGPSLLPPEAGLTVPQILQAPGVSQLQRTVKAAGDTTLTHREALQNAARLRALDRISPVSGTVQQAAEDFGTQVERFARPAEEAARARVSGLYDAVDPFDESRLQLPIERMQSAKEKFMGRGTFGSGRAVDEAISTAKTISNYLDASSLPEGVGTSGTFSNPISFRELQNLRSSIGEAANAAQVNGRNREFAALSKMIGDIDSGVEAVANGKGSLQEYFPPDVVKAWKEANAAHAENQLRFKTGPQASMFRMGGDGQPAAQGAELAGKFFNATRAQTDDVKAFKRLIGDNEGLSAALKNYGVTDLANQTDRLGNLSASKFNNWLEARSGAVKETFSDQERATMRKIAEDLIAADKAENLGRSTGSNTVQNAQNALSLGLLDSPGLAAAANRIPFVSSLASTGLGALKESAKKSKAQSLGGLLSDPERMDSAIGLLLNAQQPAGNGLGLLGRISDPALPYLYRGAPLLGTSQ